MATPKSSSYDIPGNYSISSIILTNFDSSETVDLLGMAQKIMIEESILSVAVHGFIEIVDTDGLHHDFPIFGQETIQITYTSDKSDAYPQVVRNFVVYKMGDKKEMNLNSIVYKLFFVSGELVNSERQKIQKSYRNQSISDIIRDVFGSVQLEVPLNAEPTVNTQRIVVPYVTPFKAITWLATFAVSNKNPNTTFLFYQNQREFKFVSLQTLLEQPSKAVFQRVPINNETVVGKIKDRSIQKIVMDQMFDSLTSLSDGVFGSTVQIYDPVTRVYKTQTYEYSDDFDSRSYIEDGDISTIGLVTAEAPFVSRDACRKFIITPTSQTDSAYIQSKSQDGEVFSKKREESLNARLSQMLQLGQIKITVDVPGDSSLTCGDVIDLVVPSFGIETKQEPNDRYYTGRYLIQTIRHMFEGTSYKCELFLLKDSVRNKRENIKSDIREGARI